MTKNEVAIAYIEFLNTDKILEIIDLFADQGKVHSPIYGVMLAKEFYPMLRSYSKSSELTLDTLFHEPNSSKLAIYFNYKWTLKNNKTVKFDVVDILYFNSENKITDLKIIYDTVTARKLIEEMRG